MKLIILGIYDDTTCTKLKSTSFLLTETNPSPALKLDTCVDNNFYSIKTSLVSARSSASSKYSVSYLSALLVAGVVYATLGL